MVLEPINTKLIQEKLKVILAHVSKEIDLSGTQSGGEGKRILAIVEKNSGQLTTYERGVLIQNVLDEVFGFGLLAPLMQDPANVEIIVDDKSSVYVERQGQKQKVDISFENDMQLDKLVTRFLRALKIEGSVESPIVTGRLIVNEGIPGPWVQVARSPIPHGTPVLLISYKTKPS
jgi:Flp pilus assembly CpaF family ATPase